MDDEPLARRRIASLLQHDDDFEVIAECEDGRAALEALEAHQPDLVFLDVQMPELDGFDVLEAIPQDRLPAIIFATAHDRYAVRAFDAHAVDYLLKPFKKERFVAALARAKTRCMRDEAGERDHLVALASAVRADRGRLLLRSQGKLIVLRLDDVVWIQASANYVHIHEGARVHQIRDKISNLERALPKERFVRIHRSTIVNLDAVAEIQACGGGEHVVVLRGGQELSLGRSYFESLAQAISPEST